MSEPIPKAAIKDQLDLFMAKAKKKNPLLNQPEAQIKSTSKKMVDLLESVFQAGVEAGIRLESSKSRSLFEKIFGKSL